MLNNVSTVRGLSALGVMVFHFGVGIPDYFKGLPWVQNSCYAGYIGLYIFFFISGLVIPFSLWKAHYKWNNMGAFLLKRWIRLEPLFLVNVLFCILLSFILFWYTGDVSKIESIHTSSISLNVLHIAGFFHQPWLNVIYWTLSVEIQYYLWIALGFYFLSHPQKYIQLLYLLGFVSISMFSRHHDVFFTYGLFFVLGHWFFLYKIHSFSLSTFIMGSIFCLLAIAFSVNYSTAVLLGGVLLYLASPLPNVSLLDWIGERAYSIYLFHLPIGIRGINYAYTHFEQPYIRVVFFIGSCMMVLICSHFVYTYIEKPFMKMSKKIRY